MNKEKNFKLKAAFILNFVILILEIVAVFLSIQRHGIMVFAFYTENSNYFALIVSFIFCVGTLKCLKSGKPLPKWIYSLRFIATVCLTITFIVSVFIIIPFRPSMTMYMLFHGSSLYQHLLCPLISLFSFICFERTQIISKNNIFYALLPTIIYGMTCVILNLFKVMTGPYPFFYFYQIPWYLSSLSVFGVCTISYLTALVLYKINNKQKILPKRKIEAQIQDY